MMRLLICTALICVCAGMPAFGQPIKIPVTITSPGNYELTDDASALTDINAIKIECSDVTIDGAGHVVTGASRENSEAVYVNKYGSEVTNVTIKNLKLDSWETAIHYNYVKGKTGDTNLISNCDITKSGTGIHIEYSDNIHLDGNTIRDCGTGVIIDQISTHTVFTDNTLKNNQQGMSITHSDHTELVKNNINTCEVYGVDVTESDGSIITDNTISDNKYAALKVENSKDATIIGNVFSKTGTGAALILTNEVHNASIFNNYFESFNDVNVDQISSDLTWNTTLQLGTNILGGPYLGGNFWGGTGGSTGFSESTPDTAGYGICDKPFTINQYNFDYLPLHRTEAKTAPDPMAAVNSTPAGLNTTNTTISPVTSPDNVSAVPSVEPIAKGNTTGNTTAASDNYSAVNETRSPVSSASVKSEGPKGLNISVTNAYPSGSSDSSGSASQQVGTPLPSIGYLVFIGNQEGAVISLKTSSGTYVALDPLKNKSLTVPVPTEGQLYTAYKASMTGYQTIEQPISQYPKAGESMNINIEFQPAAIIQNQVNLSGNSTSLQVQSVHVSNSSVSGGEPVPVISSPRAEAVSNTTVQTIPVQGNGAQTNVSASGNPVITAAAGPGGKVIPEGAVKVRAGTGQTFGIIPNDGKKIDYILVDGKNVTVASSYDFTNVTTDHQLVIGFA